MPRKPKDLTKPEKTEVTVRGVAFALEEFPEHVAEVYDDFYAVNGGQQLTFDYQMLQVKRDRIPRSEVVNFLTDELDPLQKRLAIRKEAYKATRDPGLRDEILTLGEEVDDLKARMRHAVRDFDFEAFFRLRGETQSEITRLNAAMSDLRLDFCHHLATKLGLTGMTLDAWRDGATKEDREAASEVVKKVRESGTPSEDSQTDPDSTEEAPSTSGPSDDTPSVTLKN